MYNLDDLMFFISYFNSTIFDIGNVVREDQKQCVWRPKGLFLRFNNVLSCSRLKDSVLIDL